MKKLTKVASFAVLAVVLVLPLLPSLALGVDNDPGIVPVNIPDPSGEEGLVGQGGTGIIELLRTILTWIGIIFWIFAVGFILYAGFLYLTAGGAPEKVTKAGQQFKFGIIAIIIGLLAYGLPRIIQTILSGN